LETISEGFSPVDPSSMLLELHALELHHMGCGAQVGASNLLRATQADKASFTAPE